ncbi:DUF29 domain-containing protein [Cysteiniphilum halobium]|uniref:DUF29 domain-containing protein n=1 Tax=Cysteiniphilum halobium TaxID=2219059 RepID=UPI000E652CA7|nr:DUF29 domain-containing protein [Cysteiniphilum halobium]
MANTLYDRDFYAWTLQTVKALRKKAFDKVDIEHLVEEVESMGKSDFRELKSRLIVLIAHLLKWEYQESQRSTGLQGTIRKQRNSIDTHGLNPWYLSGKPLHNYVMRYRSSSI